MDNTPQILAEKDGDDSSSTQKDSASINNRIEVLEIASEIMARAKATLPSRNIPELEYYISSAAASNDLESLLVYEKLAMGTHPIGDIATIISSVRAQTNRSVLDILTPESLVIKNEVLLELLSATMVSFLAPNAEQVTAYAIIHPEKTPAIIDLIRHRSIFSFEEIIEILSSTALPFADGAL